MESREDSLFSVGFHEYYCHKGLIDQLPALSTRYEKALAVCVNGLILSRSQALIQENSLANDILANTIINDVTATVRTLYARRLHITFNAARAADFNGAVYALIAKHIARLDVRPPCGLDNTKTFLFIKDALKHPLLP